MRWLQGGQQFSVHRVLGGFLPFSHCRLWKTKSQGFELSDSLAGRFLMPLAVLLGLERFVWRENQGWGGLRFDVKTSSHKF